jgi:hypothetical protein
VRNVYYLIFPTPPHVILALEYITALQM